MFKFFRDNSPRIATRSNASTTPTAVINNTLMIGIAAAIIRCTISIFAKFQAAQPSCSNNIDNEDRNQESKYEKDGLQKLFGTHNINRREKALNWDAFA